MNDPKDITISIENANEINTLNDFNTEQNNKKTSLTEDARLDNLLFHLRENLSKRFYKKTLKEIDLLIQNNYLQNYTRAWKIYLLKIRVILKIVKNKIKKYLIQHLEKVKIKHHISNIKKYLNQILNELNQFFEDHIDSNTINDGEKINDLLICYFEYIYLYSFFNKKIGNIIESISYLSFVIRLNKETQFIVKSERTISHIEKCFILLIHMLICNEDYFSAFEYINTVMDLCLKHIIYVTDDLSDGIFMGDKKNIRSVNNKNQNSGLNKNENILEDNYGDKIIKRVIMNIIIIYFYRGICYESIYKMKHAIKCYYQCLFFINHFFYNSLDHLSDLIQNILNKTIEFKEAMNYLEKRINNYEQMQLLMKDFKNKKNSEKEEKNGSILYNNSLKTKKYKSLMNKLSKLKINEIDTINKFEIKKNIKSLSARKREGKDKNLYLSDIRLLETYLRDDFRNIIDDMPKIKTYDMDFSTRDKIQKFLRRIYFEQNQRKLNKRKKNDLYLSKINGSSLFKNNKNINKDKSINSEQGFIQNNIKKNDILTINKKLKSTTSTFKSSAMQNENFFSLKSSKTSRNIRSKSAISEEKNVSLEKQKSKRFFSPNSPNSFKSDYKNQTNDLFNKEPKAVKKVSFISRYRKMKLSNANILKKIEVENKELNNFFNKKYIKKRNFVKKLEDREFNFQKCILKLKNTPKASISLYNKEVIKQDAAKSFEKMMSLLSYNPVNWKENLSAKEIKNIMLFDKLETTMIKSLDNNALTKYKKEKSKQKPKKNLTSEQLNLSLKNINDNNKNMIKNIDIKLQELKERGIIENKNYQKLLIENRKYLKYKNERNSPNSNQHYIGRKCKSINISA